MPNSKPSVELTRPAPKEGSGFKRFAVLLLGAWFVAMLLGTKDPDEVEAAITPAAQRTDATVSKFPLLDGHPWNLADHRGKVVLVNLWATWCPPCRAETPGLSRLANELKKDGLEVVGVSMDVGDAAPIHDFAKRYAISYPLARGDEERAFSLGVPLPTTYVYDRQGKLAITTVGAIEERPFRELLRKLLAEPARK